MSRVCQVTGNGPKTGNTVSHANNRKRRRFLPNLHSHRFWLESEKRWVSLRVSTRGLRTIEKRGVIPGTIPGGHDSEGVIDLREGIGRNVFGCDICQDVCPWNKKAEKSAAGKASIAADPELAPRTALVNPALDWLAAMSERDFGEWFYGSPVKRARFDGFRRNLAIAMGNSGLQRFLPQLREWAKSADPGSGLSDAAEWAVARLESGSMVDDGTETRTAP